jgi:hypothetical protein
MGHADGWSKTVSWVSGRTSCWPQGRFAGGAQLRKILISMIGGPRQRRRGHQHEALGIGDGFEPLELIGRPEPIELVMFGCRLQILADGQEIDDAAARRSSITCRISLRFRQDPP